MLNPVVFPHLLRLHGGATAANDAPLRGHGPLPGFDGGDCQRRFRASKVFQDDGLLLQL
jgi:hypothetical protein